jgi:hypothetical protein
MKHCLSLLTCWLILLPYSSFPQEYSYAHYDIKDGLAGSNVYCITQDKQGFIWMGTEGGVSRFDGTHFKNFNLEDGLPDIEVLQIFADSRGRVWMGPFSKSVCYYFNGKIHNQENDPLLKKIHVRSGIMNFAEDRDGNLLIQERSVLHLVTAAGLVEEFDTIGGRPIQSFAISRGPDSGFLVQDSNQVYHFSGNEFVDFLDINLSKQLYSPSFICIGPQIMAWKPALFKNTFLSLKQKKKFEFDSEKFALQHLNSGRYTMQHVNFSIVGDSLVYRNGTRGTTEYNLFTGTVRQFQLNAKISRTFRDDEGSIWFTSLGQGVFRLHSENIKTLELFTKHSIKCGVFTIQRSENELLVGAGGSMLFRFVLPSLKDGGSYEAVPYEVDEVHYVQKMRDSHLIIGTSTLVTKDFFPNVPAVLFSMKTGCQKNDSEILAGGYKGVWLLSASDLRVKDTLFRERATVVYFRYGTTYIGTLNGLFVMDNGGEPVYWGNKDPLFQTRISAVVQGQDSTVWIATYGGGIIGWKNGRRVARLTRKQGLSSDLCRVLSLHGNVLWVGTDKGLNRVEIGGRGYPITSYTANDGLSSDIIDAIYVDSAMVYVGTPAGLSFFDADHVGSSAGCRLVMLGVLSSGMDRLDDTAALRLSYKGNNIRFEYAGISYKSAGNITYRYRLLGLDSTWKTTIESFLDYPTLPSGDYELQLRAINKFGVESRQQSIRFSVATPFWKTTWFDAVVLALFVFLTWLFVTLRIKQLRRRQAEKDELYKRLAETEHMALQAQMNPHFIFNCLNSIQQYIFDQDIFSANKYITGFAKLIRATLHNSSKPSISLAEEIDYLSAYLSLEKLRFKEKMDYTIEVAPSLRNDLENIHIPPMLIQPYVENSMRHGLRHRTGSGGYIHISIEPENDKLKFIVEDNGIGRKQAARYKTREHIEYQSKGMSLTADRIRLINTASGDSIRVEVLDITDTHGRAGGTRVIVWFPRHTVFQKEDL